MSETIDDITEFEGLDRLALHSDHADRLHLRGLMRIQHGEPEAGAALIREAMALAPGRAPHHHNLALAYHLLGQDESAVREYRVAAALRPDSAEIHNNLASVLRDLGRDADAVAHYREAAEHAPDIAEIWYNLANALAECGDPDEVEACFQRAITLKPDFAHVHANFGRWLVRRARWREAVGALNRALTLQPADAAVWSNLGIALQEMDRAAESEGCYRHAIALNPKLADAHYNLGCLLHVNGATDAAIACHEAALAAEPLHGAARLALCMAQLPIVYRDAAEITARRQRYEAALTALEAATNEPNVARAVSAAIGAAQPFFLACQNEDDLALQARHGRLACRLLARDQPPARPAHRAAKRAKIRLGIVSGFFREHTVFKLFLEGWLGRIDRTRFEVIGIHTGRGADARTDFAARHAETFIQGLSSATAWRDAIIRAEPDVLLYPEIGMDPVAARLAALRLAPVQCVAWGHPTTSGMPSIDHFLSSALMEPRDGDAHYTEHLVRLPNLGTCYLPDDMPPDVPGAPGATLDRAALGLDADAPVFWSGQALHKYLPAYDALFPRIAGELGPCQFVFIAFAKSPDVTEHFRARLRNSFAAAGLNFERHCVILPPLSQARFIEAACLADVILDTPGWSGGKSTLDCLAVDPAIVTLPGRFMRARHTAAILHRIGCTDTIAASPEDYVALAVRLGRDKAWRDSVRAHVAASKAAAFGDVAPIRTLEDFLVGAVART